MKKSRCPLSISAYFLDFSYPGNFNLETRVFIHLPSPGTTLVKGGAVDIFGVCLEMNSVFNKEGYYDTENSVDLGLKVMINSKELSIPASFKKSDFYELNEINDATHSIIHWFESEKELYTNLESFLNEFLKETYLNNWMNFYAEKRTEYDDPFKKRVPVTDSEKLALYNVENKKIENFIKESQKRFKLITETVTISDDILKRLNLQVHNSSDDSSIGQGTSLYNNKDLVTLTKISKTKQFYELSNEVRPTQNQTPRTKKI